MRPYRTDLALEARELWEKSAEKTASLPGVRCEERRARGFSVIRVDILDGEGAAALGKPVGSYRTVDISPYFQNRSHRFSPLARLLADELGHLLPKDGGVFVAGLGNRAMTPDAVGPTAVEHLLITRHLTGILPQLRPLSAAAAGVLGTTGLESGEWVRGLARQSEAKAVIVIDALAAHQPHRLCSAVQLSDTGIIPGSGVGNARMALNKSSLGLPVISVGVPTVVDAAVLASENSRRQPDSRLFVTPRDVDQRIMQVGKLIGYAINLAVQPGLSVKEVAALLE